MSSPKPEHTAEQKRQMYDNLPEEQKKKQTYTEWLYGVYANQYENWMPWIEDQYLRWFGKDNKASYATKQNLDKSKITGVKQVDQIQDDVNNLVANQVGPNGLLAPVGNMVSKEGINRAERGGKDDKGTYGGPVAGYSDPVIKNAQSAGQGMVVGAQKVGGGVTDGMKGAGGYVGGLFGGGKKRGDEV